MSWSRPLCPQLIQTRKMKSTCHRVGTDTSRSHNILERAHPSKNAIVSFVANTPNKLSMAICFYIYLPVFLLVGLAQPIKANSAPLGTQPGNRIAADFSDLQYRIERQFFPPSVTAKLLNDLVHKAIPRQAEREFPREAVRKVGDAGINIPQYQVEDYAAALHNFATAEYHQLPEGTGNAKHSLVYYIEQTDGPSYERSKEIISTVAAPSILANGGTAHLYMSSPGSAALNNHTDTTNIVVLQLEGAKEWLLCTDTNDDDESVAEPSFALRSNPASQFSRKLDSCSTYGSVEMDLLDCKSTILYPGDVLYLPRRVVHSARALSGSYSAHLTFGFNENAMCKEYRGDGTDSHPNRNMICWSCDHDCDTCCDGSCDYLWGIADCDSRCDSSCDKHS